MSNSDATMSIASGEEGIANYFAIGAVPTRIYLAPTAKSLDSFKQIYSDRAIRTEITELVFLSRCER